MATAITIGGDGSVFVGEDKQLRLRVLDAAGLQADITGWSVVFDVRKLDASKGDPIFTAAASIIGIFDASPASNTQRARVVMTSDDLDKFKEGPYRCSWKRTDPGEETVLAWGDFLPQKATAP
jgi:hypothetical protein